MAMMLTLLKKVRERDAAVRAGQWREPYLLGHVRRPAVRRISRHHGRPGRARPHRHARRAAAGAVARAHHRLRSLHRAGALPARRRRGGRLQDAAARVRRRVVPRRAHARRRATCSRSERARADEARRVRHQHGARQGDRRSGARARDRGRAHRGRRDRRVRRGAAARGFTAARRSATRCCCRRIPPRSTRAASCAPASPGRPARCWRRSPASVPDNVYNKDVIPRWKERFGGVPVVNL